MNKIGRFFAGIGKFFRGIAGELKKVTWPSRKQVVNNTGIVIVCIIVIGIAIWILDAIFGWGLTKFVSDLPDAATSVTQ